MNSYPQFPEGFYFGSATAAYQIEGGRDTDGKGRSIWDVFVHKRGKIKNGDTGDVACNTYHDFQTDVDIMAELEMNAYRFSIAWSRVLPQGKGAVNAKGLDYYNRLVDALLAKNITPFVTLYHWDMPQALFERYGGFALPAVQPVGHRRPHRDHRPSAGRRHREQSPRRGVSRPGLPQRGHLVRQSWSGRRR